MRKSVKATDKIIAELEKHGIVLNACSKVGISTSTYYRWCDDDSEFRVRANEAIEIGRRNITDLAESKLIQNIRNGDQRAVEFQLKGNDRRYMPMNHKNMHDFMEDWKAKNDMTQMKENLEYLATGLMEMYKEDDLEKFMLTRIASAGPLEKHPEYSRHGGMTEEQYIGRMMATATMQEVLSYLKNEIGSDVSKSMGRYNAEDTEYDYPEARRQLLLDYHRECKEQGRIAKKFEPIPGAPDGW
ncbi:hypothetical protein FWF93_02175 [Candidatus Saccharibacteria bacterium]|nr:hypothetical protein [Candidatus Saccharibacteria bacterium]